MRKGNKKSPGSLTAPTTIAVQNSEPFQLTNIAFDAIIHRNCEHRHLFFFRTLQIWVKFTFTGQVLALIATLYQIFNVGCGLDVVVHAQVIGYTQKKKVVVRRVGLFYFCLLMLMLSCCLSVEIGGEIAI